jgi:hypothetical protein
MRLTKAQQRALERKWLRGQHEHGSTLGVSYLTFRRSVKPLCYFDQAVTVKWCGMWLAIEADGYTHS